MAALVGLLLLVGGTLNDRIADAPFRYGASALLIAHVPLSAMNAAAMFFFWKLAERRTSRLPPGRLPACGSVGGPDCCCQSP